MNILREGAKLWASAPELLMWTSVRFTVIAKQSASCSHHKLPKFCVNPVFELRIAPLEEIEMANTELRNEIQNPWTPELIREKIQELCPWFHNMDLGGIQTAPEHFLGDYPAVKWNRFSHAVPSDLSGKTVLDIGCNAGFYSLEMKRRGARRVLGIDSDERYLAQARLAARLVGLGV